MKHVNRRHFLKETAAAGAALSLLSASPAVFAQSRSDIVVVKNASPVELVRTAVEKLGGMQRFVKKGDQVLLKPNIAWDRSPEQAATTNPEAVAEVVKMCREAGAKNVLVLDRTCNQARRCYRNSQIEKAAKEAGATVRHVIDARFEKMDIPQGEYVNSWDVYRDVMDSDVMINMPIAKTHGISTLTLGMKNLMGVLGGNRGGLHRNFHEKIVDINTAIVPDLTIIDAYRILTANGPSGGNLEDVKLTKTVIAGTNTVSVDACATGLFGLKPTDIGFLVTAHERGMGEIDLNKLAIETVDLSA
ncbi:MAG: DUF362 domain-containing protein [candidate division KSB1 bacterium]|nr:DUF362 domain-containing protein [candidate division KSB1 bacterium]